MSAPQLKLYFDNSTLEPIARQDAGGRLKALLKAHSAVAIASVQNLVEIWRMPDTGPAVSRPELMRTLLQVAREREVEPIAYRTVMAVVRQLQRHHPDWIVSAPNLRSINERRNRHREVWDQVKNDPSYRPKGVTMNDTFLRGLISNSMRLQKKRRQADRAGVVLPGPVADLAIAARLQPLVDSLASPDRYWREQSGGAWWLAAMRIAPNMSDLEDWLGPYLLQDRLDPEAWMRFWLGEVDAAAIPITRVVGLLDFFQTQSKVDRGNWGDVGHAAVAVDRDYLITADRGFYQALGKTRAQPGVSLAAPILVDRDSPDIFAAIRSGLGW